MDLHKHVERFRLLHFVSTEPPFRVSCYCSLPEEMQMTPLPGGFCSTPLLKTNLPVTSGSAVGTGTK